MKTNPQESPLARVDFLDLISHELRQPLTAARGSLATVMDKFADLAPPDRQLLLDIAARNLDQLSALLDSLRIFSDADRGVLEVNVEPVSVDSLFADSAQDFPEERTRRQLETHCPPGLTIEVDKTLFKQVITNIVANAIKFSPAGSVITLSAFLRDDDVLILIKDQGLGLPEHETDRIFEKSVRLDHGASGLGLGLYVARAIVNAHHGRVIARSEHGQGSTFEVAIPA
ncbi:MAG TPA: HAMP domain-containing sensor histidine kinase [Actinomycetota bacterium]|nr:HAMP domain-containing sensor histidine kinase [Actinomycetota bacterium]